MASNSPEDAVRKDAEIEEVSPEMLEVLADRVQGGSDVGDGDDEIISLDEDGEGDDDAGEDGDDDDVGDNFDPSDDEDEDSDEDDEDDDEDDDLDDDDEDTDDDDEDDDMNDDIRKAAAPEGTDDEKDSCEDGEEDEDEDTKKSVDAAADLRRAVDAMVAHGRRFDPQMRKEALLAKELNGGGLPPEEKLELSRMLVGKSEVTRLQKSVLAAQNGGDEALKKSMVSNETMGLAYDNITKSLLAQAEHLESSCQGIEQTQFLMAKALVKVGETLTDLAERHEGVAKSLKVLSRQPVAPPRSVGVDWARKSLAGARVPDGNPGADRAGNKRLAKASTSRIDEALDALAKSAGPQSEMGRAFNAARDAVAINRPLMPSIAAKVEEYLADH